MGAGDAAAAEPAVPSVGEALLAELAGPTFGPSAILLLGPARPPGAPLHGRGPGGPAGAPAPDGRLGAGPVPHRGARGPVPRSARGAPPRALLPSCRGCSRRRSRRVHERSSACRCAQHGGGRTFTCGTPAANRPSATPASWHGSASLAQAAVSVVPARTRGPRASSSVALRCDRWLRPTPAAVSAGCRRSGSRTAGPSRRAPDQPARRGRRASLVARTPHG